MTRADDIAAAHAALPARVHASGDTVAAHLRYEHAVPVTVIGLFTVEQLLGVHAAEHKYRISLASAAALGHRHVDATDPAVTAGERIHATELTAAATGQLTPERLAEVLDVAASSAARQRAGRALPTDGRRSLEVAYVVAARAQQRRSA